jgi:hypothetical protein
LYSGTNLSSTTYTSGQISYSSASLTTNSGDLRISGTDGNSVVIQNGSTATVLDRLITFAGTGSAGHTLRIFERGNSAKVNFYTYSTFARRTTPTNTDGIFTSLTYIGGSGESTFTNPTIAIEIAGAAGSSGSSGQTGAAGSSGSSGSSGQSGAAGSSGSSGQTGAAGSSGTSGSSGQSGAAGSSGTSGTSPSTSDFVTISTAQTITGEKTFAGRVRVNGGSDTGGYYTNFQSNGASRSFRISSEHLVYGDFVIQRSTTQTGTTYENLLYFDANRDVTFPGSIFNDGLLRTRGSSNTVFFSSAANSAVFGAVLGDSTTTRTAFFRSNSTTSAASVWWGLLDSSGRNIPVAAIDGLATGGLTFWHNGAGSGGGNWTKIFEYNADGVGINTTPSASNKLTIFQGGGVRVTGITNGTYIELSGDLPGYSANLYPVIKSGGTIHFANNGKYSGFIEGNDTYFGLLNNSGTTRVFLNTNGDSYLMGGNLGIGVTAPSAKLQVDGNVYVSNAGGALYFNRPQGATVGALGWRASDDAFYVGGLPGYGENAGNNFRVRGFGADLILGTAGSDRVFLIANGNLGINKAVPVSTLDVQGLSILVNSTGNSYNENIRLPESNNGFAVIHMGGAVATSGSGANTWSLLKTSSALSHRFEIRHNNDPHLTIATGGATTFSSTISASNFSGTSSGTNTGDQDLSGYVTLSGTQSITGQKTLSRVAGSYGGTVQSFLIDGAAGNGALTINSASAYAYLNFAQTGTTKMEIGIVGTAGARYGSLYINRNIQTGETGASITVRKSNGYVGINQLDPAYNLHVTTSDNEGIYLQGTGGGVWMNVKSVSGKMWSYGAQNDGCAIYNRTDGAYVFFIKDNGFAGIGITDPGYKLHVYTDSDVWHAVFGSSVGQLRIGGATSEGAVIQSYTPGGTVRQLYIQRDGGNVIFGGTTNTTVGSFTNTKVGIKQAADGVSGGGLHIEQASNTNVAYFGFTGSVFQIGTSYRSTGSYQPISLVTSAASRIYIETNGYVGIGNTNPGALMHVSGRSYIGTMTDYSAAVHIRGGFFGGPRLQIYGLDSDSNAHMGLGTDMGAGAYELSIFTSNYAGFGTIRFGRYNGTVGQFAGWTTTGLISTGGTLTMTGDIVAYGSPSDIKFKENVRPFESSSLERIMKLRGVSFTWKEDTEMRKLTKLKDDVGFIAQEVQEIFPEIVRRDPVEDYLSIRDRGLIAHIVEAIKEQQVQIESQKSQNEELIKRIRTLESILQNKGI